MTLGSLFFLLFLLVGVFAVALVSPLFRRYRRDD